MRSRGLWLIFFLISMTGCRVGPAYRRPCVDVPAHWNLQYEEMGAPQNMRWWEQFGDPVLPQLIEIALSENKDLKIATARIDQFIGRYQVTRSDLYPQIGLDTTYGRQRVNERAAPLSTGTRNPSNIYQVLLVGSFELDLFGKIRSASDAVLAEINASCFARQAVAQTLVAAVATAYIDLLGLDLKLLIARMTADTRGKTLDIFNKRYNAGVISKLELSQIESEYQDALAQIPLFEKQVSQQEYTISLLLGQNPSSIARGGTLDALATPVISEGIPSDLLCQRPEILEAESRLVAANARIGVAKAAYFPTISLTGTYGSLSEELKDLFKGDSRVWSYFVPVSMPIFTAGQIAGEVAVTYADRQEALYLYQQRIQEAFKEVEDALVDIERTYEQKGAQEKQVEALEEYARLANHRYNEGYTSYLEVLDAESRLFRAQLQLADTKSNFYTAFASLYRALGGCW
ncbi:MAG: efflux transporter outer membrane subunit [Waddliaceae bacterium]